MVVFRKEERFVAELIASGVSVNGAYLQVSVPSTWVTGVPPFISNEALEELQCFSKLARGFRTVVIRVINYVQSFSRQMFMFLNCQSQMLDVLQSKTRGGTVHGVRWHSLNASLLQTHNHTGEF